MQHHTASACYCSLLQHKEIYKARSQNVSKRNEIHGSAPSAFVSQSQHTSHQQHKAKPRVWPTRSRSFAGQTLNMLKTQFVSVNGYISLNKCYSLQCCCNTATKPSFTHMGFYGIPTLNGQCVKFVFCQGRMMKSWHVSTSLIYPPTQWHRAVIQVKRLRQDEKKQVKWLTQVLKE